MKKSIIAGAMAGAMLVLGTAQPVSVAASMTDDYEFKPDIMPNYNVPLSKDVQTAIWNYCQKKDVKYEIVLAMIATESSFNPTLVGATDDYGLLQWHKPSGTFDMLTNKTARELHIPIQAVDWKNPIHNAIGAIWYIKFLHDKWAMYGYDTLYDIDELVPLSYNLGFGGARTYLKSHTACDWKYVQKVNTYKLQLMTTGMLR